MGEKALATTEKRARRQHALIVFEDESGVSMLPSVRATWAPRGQTPVLRHRFNWKRLSLAGALAYEPDGTDAHLIFELRPGAYTGCHVEPIRRLRNFVPTLQPSQLVGMRNRLTGNRKASRSPAQASACQWTRNEPATQRHAG